MAMKENVTYRKLTFRRKQQARMTTVERQESFGGHLTSDDRDADIMLGITLRKQCDYHVFEGTMRKGVNPPL